LDYNYVRWQVIDTPGILDHPLEDRNTIEMTAITALAHLPASVLFVLDISEMCGYTLPVQVALFHSIKPLFRNRPLLILLNKTDLRKMSDLSEEEHKLIKSMAQTEEGSAPIEFFETSCATKEGVDAARAKACDLLMDKRITQKVKMGKAEALKTRLHIVGSAPPSDRPPCIPQSVLKERAGDSMAVDEENREPLERERMEELGGAGVYSVDLWRKTILEDQTWKYDVLPEIMDGQNVADFVDPDIDAKLVELEKEEALLMQESKLRDDDEVLDKWQGTKKLLGEVHSRIRQKKLENRLNKSRNHVTTPRKAQKKLKEVETKLNEAGLDSSKVRARSMSRGKRSESLLGKRKRTASVGESAEDARASSLARARSKGLPSEEVAQKLEKVRRKKMRLWDKQGKKGEADRHIGDKMPKHLYSGKRGIGHSDWR